MYININYDDTYGEKHNDIYILSNTCPYKVSDEEKEKILFDIQDSFNKSHSTYYDTLTAGKINKILYASY